MSAANSRHRLLATVLATVLLSGGFSETAMINMPAKAQSAMTKLAGTSWLLQSLDGQAVARSERAPLKFAGSVFYSKDGCNGISGGYLATGTGLALKGPFGGTLMACSPAEAAFGKRYTDMLRLVASHEIIDGALVLRNAAGKELGRFSQQPTSLAGTRWRVTGYNDGRQAVVSTLNTHRMHLRFVGDTKIEGYGGCNNFVGSYSINQTLKTISIKRLTAVGGSECSGAQEAERLTEQSLLLKALQQSWRYDRTGEHLNLRHWRGATQCNLTQLGD